MIEQFQSRGRQWEGEREWARWEIFAMTFCFGSHSLCDGYSWIFSLFFLLDKGITESIHKVFMSSAKFVAKCEFSNEFHWKTRLHYSEIPYTWGFQEEKKRSIRIEICLRRNPFDEWNRIFAKSTINLITPLFRFIISERDKSGVECNVTIYCRLP